MPGGMDARCLPQQCGGLAICIPTFLHSQLLYNKKHMCSAGGEAGHQAQARDRPLGHHLLTNVVSCRDWITDSCQHLDLRLEASLIFKFR